MPKIKRLTLYIIYIIYYINRIDNIKYIIDKGYKNDYFIIKEVEKMANKTKDYVLRAQKNYQDKFDRILFLAPLGTKEKIKEAAPGLSMAQYINALISEDLKKRGIE